MDASMKIDKRIIKSKKAIKKALLELLSTRQINRITVKELSEKADINRKTFYNYYNTVYDVLDEIENDVVNVIGDTLKNVDMSSNIENPDFFADFIVNVLTTDLDFYRSLFLMKSNGAIMQKLINFVCIRLVDTLQPYISIPDKEFRSCVKFFVSGAIIVIQSWFMEDEALSLNEMASCISKMCYHSIKGLS